MKILKVNPENLRESEKALIQAAQVIYQGGTVVIPTDTVYGLAADATRDITIERIFKTKKRPKQKAISVIVSDLNMAKKIAFIDSRLERSADLLWPGPLTVVLKSKLSLPRVLTAGKSTIGVRVPDYKLTQYLVGLLGRPITATSANVTGQQPARKIDEVIDQFKNQYIKPDLILDAGELKCSQPSTILDLTTGQPKIVRIGPVSKKKLLEILSI